MCFSFVFDLVNEGKIHCPLLEEKKKESHEIFIAESREEHQHWQHCWCGHENELVTSQIQTHTQSQSRREVFSLVGEDKSIFVQCIFVRLFASSIDKTNECVGLTYV